MDKSNLRKSLRKLRNDFVLKRENISFNPPDNLAPDCLSGKIVAGYVSNGKEPDILPWLTKLCRHDVICALPRIAERGDAMIFSAWKPGALLERADFGFDQPTAAAATVTPDVVLVPLLGFDLSGNRLGQGQGHYDRALARLPDAKRYGIAWSVQSCAKVPVDHWDLPMDQIITEHGIVFTRF